MGTVKDLLPKFFFAVLVLAFSLAGAFGDADAGPKDESRYRITDIDTSKLIDTPFMNLEGIIGISDCVLAGSAYRNANSAYHEKRNICEEAENLADEMDRTYPAEWEVLRDIKHDPVIYGNEECREVLDAAMAAKYAEFLRLQAEVANMRSQCQAGVPLRDLLRNRWTAENRVCETCGAWPFEDSSGTGYDRCSRAEDAILPSSEP